jgi:hypothetical protein
MRAEPMVALVRITDAGREGHDELWGPSAYLLACWAQPIILMSTFNSFAGVNKISRNNLQKCKHRIHRCGG